MNLQPIAASPDQNRAWKAITPMSEDDEATVIVMLRDMRKEQADWLLEARIRDEQWSNLITQQRQNLDSHQKGCDVRYAALHRAIEKGIRELKDELHGKITSTDQKAEEAGKTGQHLALKLERTHGALSVVAAVALPIVTLVIGLAIGHFFGE
jgi:hypothetical protein